jgi:hypothetical protein
MRSGTGQRASRGDLNLNGSLAERLTLGMRTMDKDNDELMTGMSEANRVAGLSILIVQLLFLLLVAICVGAN